MSLKLMHRSPHCMHTRRCPRCCMRWPHTKHIHPIHLQPCTYPQGTRSMTLQTLLSLLHNRSRNCSQSCCLRRSWSPRGIAGTSIRRWLRSCPSICQRCTTRTSTRRRSLSSPSTCQHHSWRNQSFPQWPSTSPPRTSGTCSPS